MTDLMEIEETKIHIVKSLDFLVLKSLLKSWLEAKKLYNENDDSAIVVHSALNIF